MKHCSRGIVACVVVGLVIALALPRFGVPFFGGSLIFVFLMTVCCVLPVLFMGITNRGDASHSCCSGQSKDTSDGTKISGKDRFV